MYKPFSIPSTFCDGRFQQNLLDSEYDPREDTSHSHRRREAASGGIGDRNSERGFAASQEGGQQLRNLRGRDRRYAQPVREKPDGFGQSDGIRVESENIAMEDFSSLRQRANIELYDVADQFAAPFVEIAKWESGEEPAPVELMRALRQIGDLQPSADVIPFPHREGCKSNDSVLFEGDCLSILPKLEAQSVDLILCDLPYGTTQNRWDSVIDLDRLWAEYRRILKPNGVVVLTAQGVFTAKLILSNEEWFKYKIVWEKSKATNFLNAKKQPLRKHEDICIFYGKPPTYNPQMSAGLPYDKGIRKNQLSGSYGDFQPAHVRSEGERYPADVVYFKTAESEAERQVWHPTQKPVDLGRYLVRTFSNEGDVVLDNAFGSGSFLVAAAMEKRKFIGIERNEEVHLFKSDRIDYVALAGERLARVGAHFRFERRQR